MRSVEISIVRQCERGVVIRLGRLREIREPGIRSRQLRNLGTPSPAGSLTGRVDGRDPGARVGGGRGR